MAEPDDEVVLNLSINELTCLCLGREVLKKLPGRTLRLRVRHVNIRSRAPVTSNRHSLEG